MDSVETHYAAHRESNSPRPSPLRVSKRSITTDSPERSPKRLRSGEHKAPISQNTGEENLSPHGKDIQALVRQEFQRRLQKKLGTTSEMEDSIELEAGRIGKKVGLESGSKLAMGRRLPTPSPKGKVIPIKLGGSISGLGTDSPNESSLDRSRDVSMAIKPPTLSSQEPSVRLVPEKQASLPKEKKVPTKHAQQNSTNNSRALVIPAAEPIKATRSTAKPSKEAANSKPLVPRWKANFTMGSIPSKPVSDRKPLRSTSRRYAQQSPSKMRVTRSVSASRGGMQTKSNDFMVPVRFDGSKGKRKYAETDEPSPKKRMRLDEVHPLSLRTKN
jgi:hypothetical protein